MNFTANLPGTAAGLCRRRPDGLEEIVRNIYPDLDKAVAEAEKKLEKVTIADEVTDVRCGVRPKHGCKIWPSRQVLACPGFPECKNTKPYLLKSKVKMSKCGHENYYPPDKKGRRFYGCGIRNAISCHGKPSEVRCPKCGGYMVERE